MGQIPHGCATTTEAIRRAIQHSQESLITLAARYGINQKTVAKWKRRSSLGICRPDQESGVDGPVDRGRSGCRCLPTAYALPLDDCLYALQPTIPHLTRSSLHRCLQRHGIVDCPMSKAPNRRRKSSSPILSATSISISPRSRRPKANFISMSASIAPANSPSCNWSKQLEGRQPRRSWKPDSCGPLYDTHGAH